MAARGPVALSKPGKDPAAHVSSPVFLSPNAVVLNYTSPFSRKITGSTGIMPVPGRAGSPSKRYQIWFLTKKRESFSKQIWRARPAAFFCLSIDA
jgi:hypothetical protein